MKLPVNPAKGRIRRSFPFLITATVVWKDKLRQSQGYGFFTLWIPDAETKVELRAVFVRAWLVFRF